MNDNANENFTHDDFSHLYQLQENNSRSIIAMDEDDFDIDEERINDHGPFNSLYLIQFKPAHMAVFIQFVLSNANQAHLFYWIATDNIHKYSSKDLKKLISELSAFYFIKSSPLKIEISDDQMSVLTDQMSTDKLLKNILQTLRKNVETEIEDILNDFRLKRNSGLTCFFGEHHLAYLNDQETENVIAGKIVEQIFRSQVLQNANIRNQNATKEKAIVHCLKIFLKKLGYVDQQIEIIVNGGGLKSTAMEPRVSILDRFKKIPTAIESTGIFSQLKTSFQNKNKNFFTKAQKSVDLHSTMNIFSQIDDSDSYSFNYNNDFNRLSLLKSLDDRLLNDSIENLSPNKKAEILNKALVQRNEINDCAKLSFELNFSNNSDSEQEIDELFKDCSWSDLVSLEVMNSISKSDIKRHEAIFEFIRTEKSYVKNLLTLKNVFFVPIQRQNLLKSELLNKLFPNMEDVLIYHKNLVSQLESRVYPENYLIGNVGDIIYNEFDGLNGNKLKELYIDFCRYQCTSINIFKKKIKKDPRLASFIMHAESNRICHRYKFFDFHSSIHQRLTKYPLLISCVLNYTDKNNTKEYLLLSKAEVASKTILNTVNHEMNVQLNKDLLKEISSKIIWKINESPGNDANIREFDISKKILLHYGTLNWRISKAKSIDVQLLLLNDCILILNKHENRFIVRIYNDDKVTRGPFITLVNAFIRDVATDKKAFFVVSQSEFGPRIFEFITNNVTEKKTWIKAIQSSILMNNTTINNFTTFDTLKSKRSSVCLKVDSKDIDTLEPEDVQIRDADFHCKNSLSE